MLGPCKAIWASRDSSKVVCAKPDHFLFFGPSCTNCNPQKYATRKASWGKRNANGCKKLQTTPNDRNFVFLGRHFYDVTIPCSWFRAHLQRKNTPFNLSTCDSCRLGISGLNHFEPAKSTTSGSRSTSWESEGIWIDNRQHCLPRAFLVVCSPCLPCIEPRWF